MHLVNLEEFKNRELVAVLKDLTQLAEEGVATGLVFVVRIGRHHRPGVVGEYKRCPEQALAAAVRLKSALEACDREQTAT